MNSASRLTMELTKIPPRDTMNDIARLLLAHGAKAIVLDVERQVTSICFELIVGGLPIPIRIPVRSAAIYRILQGRHRQAPDEETCEADRADAERIAWRQIFVWLERQLTLLETGMLGAEELFLGFCDPESRRPPEVATEVRADG